MPKSRKLKTITKRISFINNLPHGLQEVAGEFCRRFIAKNRKRTKFGILIIGHCALPVFGDNFSIHILFLADDSC